MTTDRRAEARCVATLLYKAWLETRGRFFAAALLFALLGVTTVLRARGTIAAYENFHGGERMPYALYVWLSLSHGYLLFLWIIAAVILGLGGLVREQTMGTVGFTLSLPASRSAWVVTRALVGALEALVLALMPGVLVALLSPLNGDVYPLFQAIQFGILIGAGGMMFYAIGFLLSHVFRAEYAAPGVGLGIAAALYVVTKLPGLEPVNVFGLMTGSRYMVKGTYLLGTDFPVAPLLVCLAVAGVLFSISSGIAAWRDF